NAGLTLTLSANNTIENVTGGALGDTLTGNALNNVIDGGAGRSEERRVGEKGRIRRGRGNDLLTGGSGNETVRFDTDNALGSDTINESGGGIDSLDNQTTTNHAGNRLHCNPAPQVANAGLTLTLSANNTIENVTGGALGDTLTGNALNNVIDGGAG